MNINGKEIIFTDITALTKLPKTVKIKVTFENGSEGFVDIPESQLEVALSYLSPYWNIEVIVEEIV